MLKFTITAALTFITTKAVEIICSPSQICVVEGNGSTIVVADKSVTDVVINCITPNACKNDNVNPGFILFSSANNTYVNCDGEASCEGVTLSFGITPDGGLDSDFDVVRSKVIVSCLGKQSCKSIDINNKGVVSNGLDIITPTDITKEGAFMNGLTVCGFDTQCTLQCGSDEDTCKDAKCFDNCECQGTTCSKNINQRPTVEPTSPNNPLPTPSPVVMLPTPEPTPSPTDARNTTTCTTDGCVLSPEENYDVICPPGITTCIVECLTESQCQEAVVVEANSDVVKIICDDKSSCKTIKVFNTEPSDITITINGENGGANMLIEIDEEKSNLTLNVNGKEGFGYGKLSCDGNCDVECNGQDACKDVIYECLAPSDECILTCDSENNKCPTIQNFGDPSCTTSDCVINADGNTRIVALNDVNKLTVMCNGIEKQCKKGPKGLQIFSAALETVLLCNNTDACESAVANIGTLTGDKVPKGFKESQFTRPAATSLKLTANCNAYGACKGVSLTTTGNVNAIIDGDGESALQDTTSVCDGCNSLDVYCREFNGCIDASIFCIDAVHCSCVNAYVSDIGNDTAELETTQYPRDSCSAVSTHVIKQKNIANINNANNMVSNTLNNGKVLIPILIVSGIIILAIGFIIANNKKSYKKINDSKGNDTKSMLKNDNIYSTYQVEMHE